MKQQGLPGVSAEIEVDRDAWCTPEWVWRIPLEAMATDKYDLDPCSNERSTVPATHVIMPPANGLAEPWQFMGDHHQVCVFCNPPFSDVTEWFKFATDAALCGSWTWGVVPHSPNIEAWKDFGPDRAWSLGRVSFVPPPGVKPSQPQQEHDLVFWHPEVAPLPTVCTRVDADPRTLYSMRRSA